MKQTLHIIVVVLSLSVGTAKSMEPTTAWHMAQTAAGSTMGVALCGLLKDLYSRNAKKESLPEAPVQQASESTSPSKPRVRLAPTYVPKKQQPKKNNLSQSSASSSSESAPRIFAQPEPQPSCFDNFKKLPRTCLQAVSLQAMMKIWIITTIAITSYTTTTAGIQGLAADLGY